MGHEANSAPPSKAPAPATAQAPEPAALTGPAFAYLKSAGDHRCAWIRQPLPSGPSATVFSFDADCAQSVFFWSPNGKEGVVLDWPLGEGQQRIWKVDFATKTGKAVEFKGLPTGTGQLASDGFRIFQVNFDVQGRLVALMSSSEKPEDDTGELGITFEGKRYPVAENERWRRLCLAYRWDGTEWKRVELKVLGSPADLDTVRSMYDPSPSRTESIVGEAATKEQAKRLTAAVRPTDKFGKWMALTTPGGPLLYRARQEDADGSATASTPVRWEQEGKWVAPEGMTQPASTDIALQLSDAFVLINVLGEKPSASVFDSQTKKNLHSVEGLHERALFWPAPIMP
ncbi:hypothetical protein [Melittangium boletus]|nr:hypothetical protein [Melittangium boletus]